MSNKDRIFLQVCQDEESEWVGEVTWCQDRINEDDVMYIRADIVEQQLASRDAEIAELRQQLADSQKREAIDKPEECLNGCPPNQVCDYCAGNGREVESLRQHLGGNPIEAARQTGYMAGHASRDGEFAELYLKLTKIVEQNNELAGRISELRLVRDELREQLAEAEKSTKMCYACNEALNEANNALYQRQGKPTYEQLEQQLAASESRVTLLQDALKQARRHMIYYGGSQTGCLITRIDEVIEATKEN